MSSCPFDRSTAPDQARPRSARAGSRVVLGRHRRSGVAQSRQTARSEAGCPSTMSDASRSDPCSTPSSSRTSGEGSSGQYVAHAARPPRHRRPGQAQDQVRRIRASRRSSWPPGGRFRGDRPAAAAGIAEHRMAGLPAGDQQLRCCSPAGSTWRPRSPRPAARCCKFLATPAAVCGVQGQGPRAVTPCRDCRKSRNVIGPSRTVMLPHYRSPTRGAPC